MPKPDRRGRFGAWPVTAAFARPSNLPAISADMANGVSLNEMVRRYGLSKSALHRHRANCIGISAGPVMQQQRAAAFTALASLPSG